MCSARRLGFRWLLACVCLIASVHAAYGGEPKIDDPAAARKLYLLKCAKCHKLYEPGKYSDSEWTRWMTSMSRKARLTPEQRKAVSQYIDENLRHPKDTAETVARTADSKTSGN
jgi:mono/diheme cytochrome c family protein